MVLESLEKINMNNLQTGLLALVVSAGIGYAGLKGVESSLSTWELPFTCDAYDSIGFQAPTQEQVAPTQTFGYEHCIVIPEFGSTITEDNYSK